MSFTERLRSLAPLDRLTAVYAAGSFMVLSIQSFGFDHLRLSTLKFSSLLVAHALLIVLVFLAATARRHAKGRTSVLAEWYPLAILAALFASVDLVHAPRAAVGLSYDDIVQRIEYATFGRQLAHDWSRNQSYEIFSWPLVLSYLGFFPLVIAAPAALWYKGHVARARQTIFGISLAFFTCYMIFLIFPVAGPSYLWGWPMDGVHSGLPSRMVQRLIDNGDSWGSAFPSSHVAASMTAAALALRNWRTLGWLLLPFAAGIAVATVYFQVHYAVDAIAGLGIAAFSIYTATRLSPVCDRTEPLTGSYATPR